MNIEALIDEVYGPGDERRKNAMGHKSRPRQRKQPPGVRQRIAAAAARIEKPEVPKLPPIVHAPCERAPFNPDRCRDSAAEWIGYKD